MESGIFQQGVVVLQTNELAFTDDLGWVLVAKAAPDHKA